MLHPRKMPPSRAKSLSKNAFLSYDDHERLWKKGCSVFNWHEKNSPVSLAITSNDSINYTRTCSLPSFVFPPSHLATFLNPAFYRIRSLHLKALVQFDFIGHLDYHYLLCLNWDNSKLCASGSSTTIGFVLELYHQSMSFHNLI